jgi:uncharacterized protein YukE
VAKAIVDPEQLKRFAGNLRQFTGQLREQSGSLQRQFSRLGDTWRDQEHERFAEEFTQMMAALERFASVSEEQIPTLQRKAAAIEQYLRSR